MKIIFAILFTVSVLYTAAQENSRGKITVSIKNNQQAAVENATAELRRAKDSSLIKVSLSDKSGIAEFENV